MRTCHCHKAFVVNRNVILPSKKLQKQNAERPEPLNSKEL